MSANMDVLRAPPHSIEAEQSVLGGLLLDNIAWEIIADQLRDTDFYPASHKLIYRHISTLIENNKPADALTVAESLERAGKLGDVGGLPYLGDLAAGASGARNIRQYAEIVKERAARRGLAAMCITAQDALYSIAGTSTPDIIEMIERDLLTLGDHRKPGGRPISEIMTSIVERIDTLYKNDGGDLTGLSTGFVDLDAKTSGLQPGDLVIVAGRPGMGKTALAMNIVEHAALQSGKSVAVFSLEMSDRQLVTRMLGSHAGIDHHKMRTGRFDDDDWNKLTTAIGRFQDAPIHIEETSALTVAEFRTQSRRLARQHELGLIVVDYLQLMSTPGKSTRNDEVGDITRAMKTLAKELDIPVIALSQLNREVERRNNRRPVMSDLRDSGGIEQDADIIIALYREEEYNADTENKGVAEAIILKQRNGATGTVYLGFDGTRTRFQNLAPSAYPRSHSVSRPARTGVVRSPDFKLKAACDQ